MKRLLRRLQPSLAVLLVVPFIFLAASCSDECESTITYTVYDPVVINKADLKNSVKMEAARPLRNPGKIYVYGSFLFVNEVNEGIHIIDNSNPAEPLPLSFIVIPGNVDLAVKGQSLYADNYIDLVVLDISNPRQVKEVNRIEGTLPVLGGEVSSTQESFVARYEPRTVTQPYSSECQEGYPDRGFFTNETMWGGDARAFSAASSGPTGQGGSMARFTITGDYLYTVSQSSLQLFQISNETQPVKGQKIQLGWGIETIFPYQNKLFIGSNSGMHIYDNSNPAAPEHLSTYNHVRACDPVVVEGNLAWVTLRSGTACQGFSNQLELLDISNPRKPQLLKIYPMQNPHGLGIDQQLLFLCEGAYGLKVFDIKDPMQLMANQLQHYKNQDAFDVIPMGNLLLMIGKDGLYQYNYSNPKQMTLLSKIPVITAGN